MKYKIADTSRKCLPNPKKVLPREKYLFYIGNFIAALGK